MGIDRLLGISTVGMAASLLLQLVAFLSPGWIVSSDPEQYNGLLYVVLCSKNPRTCLTKSIIQYFRDLPAPYKYYRYQITTALCTTVLPLVLCGVVLAISLIALKKNLWPDSYKFFNVFCLAIACTLQWTTVAEYINGNVESETGSFPWGLFIYAVGACLALVVMVISLVILWNKYIRRQGQAEHLIEANQMN